jgi:ubiquinone/menaquinone biosynthesis C-methylase UbiE
MSKFDDMARTWDENPIHMARSQAIALKMEEKIPLRTDMKALEYGAGTGILSFLLASKLGHITMMDSSAEMVKVMEEKVIDRNATTLTPSFMNLEKERPYATYALLFNQMVLHHISDTLSIFEKFYSLIVPGGYLAIADLYTEDGSFHGAGAEVHQGFDPQVLREMLLKTGFRHADFEECYVVKRENPGGKTISFPIFLLVASK